MISYQSLYERAQTISGDIDATTLALFKSWISEGMKKSYRVLNAERFLFTATDATVASQGSYPLPAQCGKIHTVTTTLTDDYIAIEFPGSEEQWNTLMASDDESEYPQFFFVKKDTVEIYPIPATADYTLTFKYKIIPKDLSADDHTTESIKTAVVGSTAIVGNTGTLWTASMVGRYFKVNADGVWYRIAAIPTATTMTLAREWAGEAITAGTSAYTIGEMSLLPDEYQENPLNYALYRYYLQKESNLAGTYKLIFEEGLNGIRKSGNNTTSGVIAGSFEIKNANDYPQSLVAA